MKTLGVIGIGAFGEFMLPHLAPHFQTIKIYDQMRDLTSLVLPPHVQIGSLQDVCSCEILILCVPIQSIKTVAENISPLLRSGQLVMDLCSVKIVPTKILDQVLPDFVEIVSLHPLFGPQSGRNGISGMNITLCDIRSSRAACIRKFLCETLSLNVLEKTPDEHDREMAYVQGLTHLVAKIFTFMDIPNIEQKTKTYALLDEMVEMIRYDSEELFLAIQRENPYVESTKHSFFDAVKRLEEKLGRLA
jgi:prephenate dehydrogenase